MKAELSNRSGQSGEAKSSPAWDGGDAEALDLVGRGTGGGRW